MQICLLAVVKSDDDKESELISEKYRPEVVGPQYFDYYNPGYGPGPYPSQPYIVELGGQSLSRGQRAIAYTPTEPQWSWS